MSLLGLIAVIVTIAAVVSAAGYVMWLRLDLHWQRRNNSYRPPKGDTFHGV